MALVIIGLAGYCSAESSSTTIAGDYYPATRSPSAKLVKTSYSPCVPRNVARICHIGRRAQAKQRSLLRSATPRCSRHDPVLVVCEFDNAPSRSRALENRDACRCGTSKRLRWSPWHRLVYTLGREEAAQFMEPVMPVPRA